MTLEEFYQICADIVPDEKGCQIWPMGVTKAGYPQLNLHGRFEIWIRGLDHRDMSDAIRQAFNAGWEARKMSQYGGDIERQLHLCEMSQSALLHEVSRLKKLSRSRLARLKALQRKYDSEKYLAHPVVF